MNPLERISSDIHHLVFQHFDYKEVLETSKASTKWNEAIGTDKCMKKVKFSLKFWKNSAGTKQEQTDEKIKIIRNTVRCYQSIAIDCRFDKNLSLEFWKLLEFLASSLTELKIKGIKLDAPPILFLSNLQVLKLTYVPTNVRNVLLLSTSSLRKLKLKMESPLKWSATSRSDQDSLSCVQSCMQRNQKLQELELHGSVQYHSFFDEDVSKIIRFQLQSLKVKTGMRLALISEVNEHNFINFLTSQSRCLKSLFIDVCRQNVIQQAFNKMPSLTSLHIDVMIMNDYKVKDLTLQLNENITDLKIPYVNHDEDIKDFLDVTPNLNSLFVAHLSREIMELIAWNLKNLTKLKFRYDEIDCEGFYEQLRDDFPDVNQNIEMIVDYDYT